MCIDLSKLYVTHVNIKILVRTDGKGKTLEYDLAFENPGCLDLLTQGLANKDELARLMVAYSQGKGLDELLAIRKSLDSSITQVPWSEDDKIRSLIATRYHRSLESRRSGGKGAHALELEYNLRMNLNNGNPSGFRIPSHIEDALNHVFR